MKKKKLKEILAGIGAAAGAALLLSACGAPALPESSSGVSAVITDFAVNEENFAVSCPSEAVFTASASGGAAELDLYKNGSKIGSMKDDGSGQDAAAGDGIYTGVITVSETEAGNYSYQVKSGSSESDTLILHVYGKPTSADVSGNQSIEKELQEIGEYYAGSDKIMEYSEAQDAIDEAVSYAEQLKEQGAIVDYETDDITIALYTKDGLMITYTPEVEGIDESGSDVSLTIYTLQPCLSGYSSSLNDVLVLPDQTAETVAAASDKYTFPASQNYDNSAVTLSVVRSFGSDMIVLWHGHGGYSGSISFLLTGDDMDWTAYAQGGEYYLDCIQKRIISASGKACFSAKYIEKYCGRMDNSFFYLGSCHSGEDRKLANSFVNKGAAAVIANSDTIYSRYNLLMQNSVVSRLVQKNSSTGRNYTLKESLDLAKQEHGETDHVWHKNNGFTGTETRGAAEAQIFGGSSAEQFTLAGTGSTSSAAALTEEVMVRKIETTFGYSVEKYVFTDMDHDGGKEMIGVIDTGEHRAAVYCSTDGSVCEIAHEDGTSHDEVMMLETDVGNETHVGISCINAMGTNNETCILALRNGKAVELLSGLTGILSVNEAGNLLLTVEDYDGMYDSSIGGTILHTYKPAYLNWNGSEYEEYGATEISEQEFLSRLNGGEVVNYVCSEIDIGADDEVSFRYFRRANGLFHVECSKTVPGGNIYYYYGTTTGSDSTLDVENVEVIPGQMKDHFTGLKVVY